MGHGIHFVAWYPDTCLAWERSWQREVEVNMLGNTCGMLRDDRIKNEVWERCGIWKSYEKQTGERIFRQYGCIERMEGIRVLKRVNGSKVPMEVRWGWHNSVVRHGESLHVQAWGGGKGKERGRWAGMECVYKTSVMDTHIRAVGKLTVQRKLKWKG